MLRQANTSYYFAKIKSKRKRSVFSKGFLTFEAENK
jgi:hypothetical protein